MARIRSLKPDFFKNDKLAEHSPLHRILFQGLWCLADSSGRLEDRPKRIKAEVLPYDECDIESMLDDLAAGDDVETKFIDRYEVDGRQYIWICKFRKHQRITGSEAETSSSLPPSPLDASEEQPKKRRGNIEETPAKHRRGVSETPRTTGKEGKGESLPPLPPQGDDAFVRFWSEYPRKDAKQAALKEWRRLRPTDETVGMIMTALEAYKQTDQWQRGIIPHARTWLHQGRWLDELTTIDLPKPSVNTPPAQPVADPGLARAERTADIMSRWNKLRADPMATDDELLAHAALVKEVNPGLRFAIDAELRQRGVEVARA